MVCTLTSCTRSMSDVFSSAGALGKRELVIKEATSSPESSAIQSGNFSELFTVTTLNHLQITGFSSLTSLSPDIGKLEGLFQLVLTQNDLTTLPDEISQLSKLKHLDVSQNRISILPSSLYELHSLQTLIISNNALTDDSFPVAPDGLDLRSAFPNLHHVDFLNNGLTKIPDFVYTTDVIQELIASDNSITVLEPLVGRLTTLKHIDLKRNKLTSLPLELVGCSKLRVMHFEDNPLSDRRLLKLVAQHGTSKPKAVLDYISTHAPNSSASIPKGKKGKSKTRSPVPSESLDDNDDVIFTSKRTRVKIVRPCEFVEVSAAASARCVRPYLVCAIVRGVDLTGEVAYREFITLQTKLHDTVCKRRRVATIATHSLDKITPPLRYSCQSAETIILTPLNWTESITARKFIRHLEASKQDNKKSSGGGKKGQASSAANKQPDLTAAALQKYLQFIDPMAMVFLQDKTDAVISLPPLTNCEISKIDSSSTDLFLEVTSSDSLASCKLVMDSLVCGMCEKDLGVRNDTMTVEQVRVVDENGQLLVLYPSRTDLTDTNFEISRP